MQFENQAFFDVGREIRSISFDRSFHSQFFQIVGFQLDTVQFVIASQFLDFFLGFFFGHNDFAFFVAGKFIEKVFVRKLLPVFFFRTARGRNGEDGHNRVGVEFVFFYFVGYFRSVFDHLRHVFEQLHHFGGSLEPFLTGVPHPVGIVDVFPGVQADQQIVCFGIFFVQEMNVVCGDNLDTQFFSHAENFFITKFLIVENFCPLFRVGCRMPHHFQVIVVSHQIFIP